MHRRGVTPSRPPIWTGPSRRANAVAGSAGSPPPRSRWDSVRGRLDRSAIPAGPSARSRAAHLRAVTVETINIFAAADGFQPSSTINFASLSRARGVRAALAWDTKVSWFVKRLLDISTSQPEAFASQHIRAVSRNNVPGHHT